MAPLSWIDDELRRLAEQDLLRDLPSPLGCQGPVVEREGRRLINFASNDYLGLAGDPRLRTAALESCQKAGVGRGASPLVCGRAVEHDQLEQRIAEFEGVEAALLFPSGYAANSGIIPALVDGGDAIYADAKNHASLIDGCRLARAETFVYPHGDMTELEKLLQQGDAYRRRLIVTDTLFSMDGDLAPIDVIAKLAQRYDAMLMIDEAHATGVFGAHGRGVAESFGVESESLIRVGTLSKALGAAGGFVCGSRTLIAWLANRARSYVFSTAQPAAVSAAAIAGLEIVAADPATRQRLLQTATALRRRLQGDGWDTGVSASQIIPIMLGEPATAMKLSSSLLEQGYWAPAIRPPSVPAGESLIRISLTASHTPDMVAGLVDALRTSTAGSTRCVQ